MATWTDQDLLQLKSQGIPPQEADRQIQILTTPPPPPRLDRPATVGDGIHRLSPREQNESVDRFETGRREGRFEKFVPASGAASRMFFEMNKALREFQVTRGELEKRGQEGNAESQKLVDFFNRIHQVGFRRELELALQSTGLDLRQLLENGNYHEILRILLSRDGLDYSSQPKGLVPFHQYEKETRTPVEEHLAEASLLVKDGSGTCRIHFTLSPDHEKAFRAHVSNIREKFEKAWKCRFEIVVSFQKPSTDTLSLDEEGKPVRDDQGRLVLRPGGHGALIENLAETRTPYLYIKNIDNVAIGSKNAETIRWEMILGGILLRRKEQAAGWLASCRSTGFSPGMGERILASIRSDWNMEIPRLAGGTSLATDLLNFLDRPMRVCGVVPNTGEPGGGPFWVRSPDGTSSLQIVESSQVDMGKTDQAGIFGSSTHFNPVDMVCAIRDDSNQPFDLKSFVDPRTVFLSQKSYRGMEIQALERPGLWNGAMAGWITFFVEMPLGTFHPVKTVFDLLKQSHQAGG